MMKEFGGNVNVLKTTIESLHEGSYMSDSGNQSELTFQGRHDRDGNGRHNNHHGRHYQTEEQRALAISVQETMDRERSMAAGGNDTVVHNAGTMVIGDTTPSSQGSATAMGNLLDMSSLSVSPIQGGPAAENLQV